MFYDYFCLLLVFTHLNTKCVKTRSKQKEYLPFNQGYQTIVFIYYREQLFLFSISVFCKYRTSGEYVTHHLWFYLLLRQKKRVLRWKKVLYFFKCLYFTFYLNFKSFLAKTICPQFLFNLKKIRCVEEIKRYFPFIWDTKGHTERSTEDL